MSALGIVWDVAAWFFLASVLLAPVVAVVRRARARGRRLFRDQPNEVLRSLRYNVITDHTKDAL